MTSTWFTRQAAVTLLGLAAVSAIAAVVLTASLVLSASAGEIAEGIVLAAATLVILWAIGEIIIEILDTL